MASSYYYYYRDQFSFIFFILLVLSSHFVLGKVENGNGVGAKCSVVSVDCRRNQDCVSHCASVGGPRQTAECLAYVLARPWKICRCCPA